MSVRIDNNYMALNILVHGYFGFGNVGDEATLSALIGEFRRINGDAEFTVLSSNPERTIKIHSVKAVRERLTSLNFWKALLKSHVLVFAGGGRYGYPTLRRMALLALLAKLLGKAVIFRAVGVYPYEWRGTPIISREPIPFKGFTGLLVRLAVESSSYISVRDTYSYAVLRLSGVHRRIFIEKDLTFKLTCPGPSECRDLAIKYGIANGKVLGVNLRTLDNHINRVVVDYVSRLIMEFLNRGFTKVIFIPFGFGSFVGRFFDNDFIIAKRLKARIPQLIIIDEELNPRKILCLFNYLDYVIAMRHHAIIFSLITNKPMIAIAYDTKTLEVLKHIKAKNIEVTTITLMKQQ